MADNIQFCPHWQSGMPEKNGFRNKPAWMKMCIATHIKMKLSPC